jgi:RNA-binding protein
MLLQKKQNTCTISSMIELSSKQRKILEKYAQALSPVVIVGQNGVTAAVGEMVNTSLVSHELVKISFNDFKEEKRNLTAALAEKYGAALVRIIGNKAILYRPAEKTADRRYEKELNKL